MIRLSTLHGEPFYLNPETIIRVEKVADTIILLSNGDSLRVSEEPEDVVDLFMNYKMKINGVFHGEGGK